MAEAATELEALSEAVVFLNHLRDLADPRQAGKVLYPLADGHNLIRKAPGKDSLRQIGRAHV